eukprot:6213192-Pleurochrysis_carterae.AAC.4
MELGMNDDMNAAAARNNIQADLDAEKDREKSAANDVDQDHRTIQLGHRKERRKGGERWQELRKVKPLKNT